MLQLFLSQFQLLVLLTKLAFVCSINIVGCGFVFVVFNEQVVWVGLLEFGVGVDPARKFKIVLFVLRVQLLIKFAVLYLQILILSLNDEILLL